MRRMFGNAFQSFDLTSPSSSPPSKNTDKQLQKEPPTSRGSPLSSSTLLQQRQAASNRPKRSDFDILNDGTLSLERLPFGSPRSTNSRPSPSSRLNAPDSRSRNLNFSQSGRSQDSFSQHSNSGLITRSSDRSPFGGGSGRPVNLKFDMMAELLCGQAMSEASSFQMLTYERVERLKKDKKKFENRLSTLNGKIKLEMKIREASIIITDTTEEIARISNSNLKLDQLREEKESIQSRLFSIQIRLLQHLAATLSLGLKKLEQQNDFFSGPTKGRLSSNGLLLKSFNMNERSPSPALTQISSRSTGTALDRFDGPHLFANNRQSSGSEFQNQYNSKLNLRQNQNELSEVTNQKLEALTGEVVSLQNMLNSKEALVAEQSAELSLLQLELDTLKRSASDSSASRNQASSLELETLKVENSRLKRDAERLEREGSLSRQESEKLKTEADILKVDLERERASGAKRDSEKQLILTNRAREAEDRAREAETAQKELNLEIQRLLKELGQAQASSKNSTDDLTELRSSFTKLEAERKLLESKSQAQSLESKSNERRSVELQAEHDKYWEALTFGLSKLNGKLIEEDRTLGPFLSTLSSEPRLSSSSSRARFVQEFVDNLESYLTLTLNRLASERASLEACEQEKSKIEARISELEARTNENEKREKQLSDDPTDAEALKAQVAELNTKLEESEVNLKEFAAVDKTLRDLYKTLPTNIEARGKVNGDSDLNTFKQAYEQPKKMGGLGGLFGLGKRAPTPVSEEVEYSIDVMAERMKSIVEQDKKLVDRLVKYEAEKDSHKNNAIRAQKLVAETQEALKTYQTQVKELEERLESSDTQSAAMLEKFNDLIESEEKANAIARRAEASTSQLQNQINDLTEEVRKYKKSNEELQKSLDDLKESSKTIEDLKKKMKAREDEVDDLLEELKTIKERETKSRNKFMSEINEIQNENDGLRTKVRQLERAERDRA